MTALFLLVLACEVIAGYTYEILKAGCPGFPVPPALWCECSWIMTYISKLSVALFALGALKFKRDTLDYILGRNLFIGLIIPEIVFDIIQELQGKNIYIEKYELHFFAVSLFISIIITIKPDLWKKEKHLNP